MIVDAVRTIYHYILGPRVRSAPNREFVPSTFEIFGNKLVAYSWLAYRIVRFFSPIILLLSVFNFPTKLFFAARIWVYILATGIGLRVFGRMTNPVYKDMINLLKAHLDKPDDVKTFERLMKYDIDLNGVYGLPVKHKFDNLKYPEPVEIQASLFQRTIAYLAINSFGCRMIYPGCTSFFKVIMEENADINRRKAIDDGARRMAIRSRDGNVIDTLLIDQRGHLSEGKTLIVVCEGNSACYEFSAGTYIKECGYSVLFWNSPGFIHSTGFSTPTQVLNAAAAVMDYAIAQGYELEYTYAYGWSIGGFPASFLAKSYGLAGVILDATFDNIVPLAERAMPESLREIVVYGINTYYNMPIDSILKGYEGRVTIYRRIYDTIMSTKQSDDPEVLIAHSRTTALIREFIVGRYGTYVDKKYQYLIAEFLNTINLKSDENENTVSFRQNYRHLLANHKNWTRNDAEKFIQLVLSAHSIDLPIEHNALLPIGVFALPPVLD